MQKRKKSRLDDDDDERKMVISMSDFNDDIVFNIFTRIPGNILVKKFKYQCCTWYNLISNPVFVETHLHQSKDGILLTVRTTITEEKTEIDHPGIYKAKLLFMDLKGLEANKARQVMLFPRHFFLCGSCNGLILFQDLRSEKIFVTNPTTRETILPSSSKIKRETPESNCRLDIVFVPSTKTYKIVALFFDCKLKFYVFHIQTLCASPTESWVPIKELDNSQCLPYYERISVNGILYLDIGQRNTIVSFDVGDEKTVRIIPLPRDYSFSLRWFIQMDGFPTLIGMNYSNGEFDVWILKDVEWVKKLSFGVQGGANPNTSKPIGCLNNGEIILFETVDRGSRHIYIFYVKTKQWKTVKELSPNGTEVAGFLRGTHVDSIVSLKGFK